MSDEINFEKLPWNSKDNNMAHDETASEAWYKFAVRLGEVFLHVSTKQNEIQNEKLRTSSTGQLQLTA